MEDGQYNINQYNNLYKKCKLHINKNKEYGNKEDKKYYNFMKKDNQKKRMLKLFNIYKFN